MMNLVPRRLTSRGLRPHTGMWSDFDRLFDDVRRNPGSALAFEPRIDVRETEDEVILRAELPGLEEKDFEVTVDADVLIVKGEKREEHETKGEGFAHVETSAGSFKRALRLPWDVDAEHVKAAYKNGVLTVRVAKPEDRKPQVRSIPITTS